VGISKYSFQGFVEYYVQKLQENTNVSVSEVAEKTSEDAEETTSIYP